MSFHQRVFVETDEELQGRLRQIRADEPKATAVPKEWLLKRRRGLVDAPRQRGSQVHPTPIKRGTVKQLRGSRTMSLLRKAKQHERETGGTPEPALRRLARFVSRHDARGRGR